MANANLKMSMDLKPLQRLAKQSPKHFRKGMQVAGIQFLTWANMGSKNTSKKPPIRFGILRGSSSVFLGNKLIETFKPPNVTGEATPNDIYSGADMVLTFGWNTNYAAKMHEWKGNWGKFTLQDSDAGDKWIEDHLDKDRNDLMNVVAKTYKKEAST